MSFSSPRNTGDAILGEPEEAERDGTRVGRTLRGLFLLLACCVLVGSYLVAGLAYEGAENVREHQETQRAPVTATIVAPAQGGNLQEPAVATRQAQARWTAPDGTTSTGTVTVDPSAAAGDQRLVWTTSSGEAVSPPMTRMQTALLGLSAGVGVSAGALALAVVAYRLPRRLASHRRMQALDSEWAEVEPRWSRM